jgi:hypothetical protein
MCGLAGVGLDAWRRRFPGWPAGAAAAVLAGTLVLSAATHRSLTLGDVGQYGGARADDSAYDDRGPLNRLLLAAGQLPDLCGLKVELGPLSFSGGYSYLHRPVPLYPQETPRSHPGFNYVITLLGSGGEIVAQEGPFVLARIRPGCRADPSYTWRLPAE